MLYNSIIIALQQHYSSIVIEVYRHLIEHALHRLDVTAEEVLVGVDQVGLEQVLVKAVHAL